MDKHKELRLDIVKMEYWRQIRADETTLGK